MIHSVDQGVRSGSTTSTSVEVGPWASSGRTARASGLQLPLILLSAAFFPVSVVYLVVMGLIGQLVVRRRLDKVLLT